MTAFFSWVFYQCVKNNDLARNIKDLFNMRDSRVQEATQRPQGKAVLQSNPSTVHHQYISTLVTSLSQTCWVSLLVLGRLTEMWDTCEIFFFSYLGWSFPSVGQGEVTYPKLFWGSPKQGLWLWKVIPEQGVRAAAHLPETLSQSELEWWHDSLQLRRGNC